MLFCGIIIGEMENSIISLRCIFKKKGKRTPQCPNQQIYKNERVYRLDAEVVNSKECSEGVLSSEHHSKNTVDESLAFCILSAYRWMRRLFAAGDIPGILKCDKPEKYQNAKIDDIPSFVIDRGKYHIETESAVKAGIWTVRVTEMSVALSKNGKHGVKRELLQ